MEKNGSRLWGLPEDSLGVGLFLIYIVYALTTVDIRMIIHT